MICENTKIIEIKMCRVVRSLLTMIRAVNGSNLEAERYERLKGMLHMLDDIGIEYDLKWDYNKEKFTALHIDGEKYTI